MCSSYLDCGELGAQTARYLLGQVCPIGNLGGRIYPQRELARLCEERGSGEIGRRTGFRFQRSKGRVGSSPTFRTKEKRPAACGSFSFN